MTRVYINYNEEKWLEREGDSSDVEWGDRDCYGGRYTVTDVGLSVGWYDSYETVEDVKPLDKVWVVWVSYTDGDTFGYDGGYGEVVAVTKDKDVALKAHAWAKNATQPWGWLKAEAKKKDPHPFPKELEGEDRVLRLGSWLHYFAHLDELFIEEFTVKP